MTPGDWIAAGLFAGATTIPFCPRPRLLSRRGAGPIRPWPRWWTLPSGLWWPCWFGPPASIGWAGTMTPPPSRSDVSHGAVQLVAVTIEQDVLVLDCVGDELLTFRAGVAADADKTAVLRRAQAWLSSTAFVSVRQNMSCDQPCVDVVDANCTTTLPVVG